MLTIPNQSSVAKAFQEFDDLGRMKPSSFYDRVVDVMKELMKFTLLTRDIGSYLTDRCGERVETANQLARGVNLMDAADIESDRPQSACCSPTCRQQAAE